MDILTTGIIFIFGTIVGSFLNVLIIRFNTGRSSAGRSGCMNCGVKLCWFNLIPVISFLFQKGTCVSCGSRLSLQYPVVELLMGALFVLSWLTAFSLPVAGFAMGVSALLLFIAAYDLRHTIIPNSAVYILGALALLQMSVAFFLVPLPFSDKLIFLLLQLSAGLSTAAPLYFIWFISKGRAMGFGDVKLSLVLGWILGIYGGFQALGLAFIVGALVGITLLYLPRFIAYLSRLFVIFQGVPHRAPLRTARTRFTLRSEIPFGPFLVVGFFLVYFFNADLLTIMETILRL